jgi:hypothetical protein
MNKSIAVAWRSEAIIIKAGGIHASKKVIVACCNQLFPVDNTKIRAMTYEDSKYIKINISSTGTAVSVLGATLAANTRSVPSNTLIKPTRIYTCFLIDIIEIIIT